MIFVTIGSLKLNMRDKSEVWLTNGTRDNNLKPKGTSEHVKMCSNAIAVTDAASFCSTKRIGSKMSISEINEGSDSNMGDKSGFSTSDMPRQQCVSIERDVEMRSKSNERDRSERGDGDAAAAIVKNVHWICAQHCCRVCVQFLLQKVGIKNQLPKMSK